MAEQVRYVQIPEHSIMTGNLSQSSSDMSTELEIAKEAADIHMEKYKHLKRAEELLVEISKDISKFVRLMPIKQPNRASRISTKSVVEFTARPTRPIMTEDDREMIARSHRALANLQKNLAELKSELGKA